MDAIVLEHVKKSYKDFTLNDVSFTLPEGCILGLAGENGAGKSTTIRLIMDAISRDSGTIKVLGTDNRSPAFTQVKEDIGVVLDEAYFPESMSAEQVGGVMQLTYSRWDAGLYASYLKRFGLPKDKIFRNYSRGMRMKLAIAVALSHAPKLLILDEATSGLDPIVRDEILELFFEFTRDAGHSILLSSHILSDLEKVCDYVAFMHKGRLLLCEEKDRLYDEYAIMQGSATAMAALPAGAVVARENGKYGNRALVRRSMVSASLPLEHANIEDILLFMVKGEMH
jgi:ABC-2 type transport system ATP-binding protein